MDPLHQVSGPISLGDQACNQLPFINEIDARYFPERKVQNLRIMNGDVTWKQQAMQRNDFPLQKENEAKGN